MVIKLGIKLSIKLGMTGNRDGISEEAQYTFQEFLNNTEIVEVHHGDCVGADKIFHDICKTNNLKIIIHPPSNDSLRAFCESEFILEPDEYLERNKAIVDSTDMLIAFPSTQFEMIRSGTWQTIRYARKLKKKILIIYPNGEQLNEN